MTVQPKPTPEAEVLTVDEAAAFLRISTRTLRDLIQRGQVQSNMVGGQHRLHIDHLREVAKGETK